MLGKSSEKIEFNNHVSNPLGHSTILNEVYQECPIMICETTFVADLMKLPFDEFDLIHGMDWLMKHGAMVDFKMKPVKLTNHDGKEEVIDGDGYESSKHVISALKAQRKVTKGCEAYLALVFDSRPKERELKDL